MPHLVELDPAIVAKLQEFSEKHRIAPEAIASEAIEAGLVALEERLFWEERRKNADIVRGLEMLRKAGVGNPPDPGDELPEDLQYLLHDRAN